jgi:transmembrane sensor
LHVSSWTSGALVAKNMRLEDSGVQELARYRHGWLLCDPAVS